LPETRSCNNCHRIGHLWRDCPDAKPRSRDREEKSFKGRRKYSDRSKKYFRNRRQHANHVTAEDSNSSYSNSSSNGEEEYALTCYTRIVHSNDSSHEAWRRHQQLEESYYENHEDYSDCESALSGCELMHRRTIEEQLYNGTLLPYAPTPQLPKLTPEQIKYRDDKSYGEMAETLEQYYEHIRTETSLTPNEEDSDTALMTNDRFTNSRELCLDSGCTKHITNDPADLEAITNDPVDLEAKSIEEIDPPSKIYFGKKAMYVLATARGTMVKHFNVQGMKTSLHFPRTLLAPDIDRKLISIPMLTKDHTVTFDGKEATIFQRDPARGYCNYQLRNPLHLETMGGQSNQSRSGQSHLN
jgi:hypothetical protein